MNDRDSAVRSARRTRPYVLAPRLALALDIPQPVASANHRTARANIAPSRCNESCIEAPGSFWTAAGQRTFNVVINGATVLTAFDIFAAAGGANRAIARAFNTTANASGQVVIQFTRGGGPDNPKVCGITVAGG